MSNVSRPAVAAGVRRYAPPSWKGLSPRLLGTAGVEIGRDSVRIPYREPDGRIRYWRVKHRDGREWFSPPPSRCGGLIPFGLETLPAAGCGRSGDAACFILEGESDTIALREHLSDGPVLAWRVLALGLPGASSWRSTWADLFAPFDAVFVCGDGDEAGRRMGRAVRADLPRARWMLLPDGQDVRSILQSLGVGGLIPLLDDAERRWRVEAAFRVPCDYSEFVRRFVERS